jgi:hypothetical protein
LLPLVSLCDHVDPQEKACTLEAVGGDAQQFNSGLILWRAGVRRYGAMGA